MLYIRESQPTLHFLQSKDGPDIHRFFNRKWVLTTCTVSHGAPLLNLNWKLVKCPNFLMLLQGVKANFCALPSQPHQLLHL